MQRTQICAALVFAVLGTGTAAAQQEPSQQKPPSEQMPATPVEGEVMAQRVTLTATVDQVDAKNRTLTLRNKHGNQVTVSVPESAGNLDQIKKGDRLTIDYYESIALLLKKPAAKEQPRAGEVEVAERNAAQLPGGVVARRMSATVDVVKVDKQHRQITIKDPSGKTDTISVDPSMESDLAKVKKGDRIKASYTEAIAISVTAQPKQGSKGT